MVVATLFTAGMTYPKYISYFPSWSGGTAKGHRWLVDSNYDWGQELEVLEKNWAALIKANKGIPPKLIYFGFVNPRVIYKMPASDPSLCGFMHRTRELGRGEQAYDDWRNDLRQLHETTVASISALELTPYAVNFSYLKKGKEIGRLGNCYYLYHSERQPPPSNEKRPPMGTKSRE